MRCLPSDNPRHHGRCVRCGMEIVASDHARDVGAEERIAREAARLVAADPEGLLTFAHRRANRGPIRDFKMRDFELEIREELADSLNYCVWGIQQLQERGEDPQKLFACLARVASAYACLEWQD